MTVQVRQNIDTTAFVVYAYPASRQDDGVLFTDAGRATPLLQHTLLGKILATGKWVPFTNEAAVDGTAANYGIYMGDDILAADIVAGDVLDIPVMVQGIRFDEGKLVIENAKTLDTVVGAASVQATTVRDILLGQNMIPVPVQTASAFENT